MKTLNQKIADVSSHLEALNSPKYSSQIQEAAEKNDKKTLVEVCKNAKIPAKYISTIVSVILSVQPQQKWPESY